MGILQGFSGQLLILWLQPDRPSADLHDLPGFCDDRDGRNECKMIQSALELCRGGGTTLGVLLTVAGKTDPQDSRKPLALV